MPRPLLLVEDNEDDVFFFQFALRKLGLPHPLVVARDGREGLRWMQDSVAASAPFALVLLDLKLPYLDGLELLAWLQSLPPAQRSPVVVLTTSEKQSDAQQALRLGAAEVRVKPNRPDQLVEVLRELDAKWLREPLGVPVLAGMPLQPAGGVK